LAKNELQINKLNVNNNNSSVYLFKNINWKKLAKSKNIDKQTDIHTHASVDMNAVSMYEVGAVPTADEVLDALVAQGGQWTRDEDSYLAKVSGYVCMHINSLKYLKVSFNCINITYVYIYLYSQWIEVLAKKHSMHPLLLPLSILLACRDPLSRHHHNHPNNSLCMRMHLLFQHFDDTSISARCLFIQHINGLVAPLLPIVLTQGSCVGLEAVNLSALLARCKGSIFFSVSVLAFTSKYMDKNM
jgi:hypothetical protein